MTENQFGRWLEQKYIHWVAETGRRRTIAEFAEWLGVSRPLLSSYMSGSRKPKYSNADLIAARLGPEAYALLGYREPGNLLSSLQAHWTQLNDRERAVIEQIVARLEAEERT